MVDAGPEPTYEEKNRAPPHPLGPKHDLYIYTPDIVLVGLVQFSEWNSSSIDTRKWLTVDSVYIGVKAKETDSFKHSYIR